MATPRVSCRVRPAWAHAAGASPAATLLGADRGARFDPEPAAGRGLSGQAMTTQYVTVLHPRNASGIPDTRYRERLL